MENQEDHDFVRRLQEITGNQVIWEPAPAEISTASAEEVAGLLYGDHGSSDDEMEMVLGMSHLNANGEAKKLPQSGQKQIGKVPKAPLKMSRKKEVARLEDAAKSWKMPSLKKGEESHEGDYFTPWKFVQGYPNMYVGKRNGERAAPFFEHEEILENRVWDLYYLRYPPNVDRKPVLFVPTTQLQNLLDVVNAKLEDTNLTIPDGKNAEKFYMTFGAGQTPRPRFLGRSTSLLSFEDLKTSFPPLQSGEALDRATPLAKDDFLDRLDMIHKAGFKDGKNKSEANRRKKIAKHRSWGQQVKRVQRYLGLRPRAPTEHTDDLPLPQSLDLARPITLEPEGSVVFVAIDVEAYEFNQDMITEVGVAILDTNDLKSVAPGEGGVDWHELIKAHHIRIRENVWAVNRKHVRGCPDQFNFGSSEHVNLADVVNALDKMINVPVSETEPYKKRQVVYVFHDATSDIKYLNTLGYDVGAYANVIDVADTAFMHQYMTRSDNPAALRTLLVQQKLQFQFLHNAGNDAMYTLRCMITLAIKMRLQSIERAPIKANQRALPTPYKETVEDDDGWESDGEMSDGGGYQQELPKVSHKYGNW